MRNARACEACRASKNRCFFADDHTTCQRCEQTKNRCIVREKARPRRARRVVGRPENANTSKLGGDDTGSPISSTPSHSGDLSSKEGDFSLDLPTTIYHDPSKDAEILQNHHKQMFKNDNSRSPTPSKEAIHQPGPSKHISARRLTLPQATHLLKSYMPKLPFFPFVTLPTNPSIPLLSQQSPFLLLAILTVAAIPHPYLHHQLDQEFRRVLSLKLIVESQKSLDYLMGLLVYVAWYPVHTKPKNNPCFTYMNLANSLALDLGLDHAEPQTNVFEGVDFRGLVGEDGTEGWTEDARKAYMGCYVLGSHLSKGFNKPLPTPYENLLPSNPSTFVPSRTTTPATAIVILERINDRINHAWTAKNYPQMDAFSTELYIQLFTGELDTWKRNVPESISSSPLLALYHKHTYLSIYSHALRLLRRSYRPFVPNTEDPIPSSIHLNTCLQNGQTYLQHLLSLPTTDYTHFNLIHWSQLVHSLVSLVRLTFVLAHVENWSSDTTREKIGLSMYLEALCFRLGSLSSSLSSSNSNSNTGPDLESNANETGNGKNINVEGNEDKDKDEPKKKHPNKYFIMHSMLSTLKRSWETRVSAIVPSASHPTSNSNSAISRGKCPMFDPSLAPLLEPPNLDFEFGEMEMEMEMGNWDDGFSEGLGMGMGTREWDGNVNIEMGDTRIGCSSTGASISTSGEGQHTVLGAISDGDGMVGGMRIQDVEMGTRGGGMGTGTGTGTLYHDLWATMTCSWAEQSAGWPMPIPIPIPVDPENGNGNGNGNDHLAGISNEGVFEYQVHDS